MRDRLLFQSSLATSLMVVTVSGCGQMGPLTRPDEPVYGPDTTETPVAPADANPQQPPASKGEATPEAQSTEP